MRKAATATNNDQADLTATPQSDAWSPVNTQGKSPASTQRGLGSMHFIRSVIQHHERGGRAEDIEETYHQIAQADGNLTQNPAVLGNDTESRRVPALPRPKPIIMTYDLAKDDDDDGSTGTANGPDVAARVPDGMESSGSLVEKENTAVGLYGQNGHSGVPPNSGNGGKSSRTPLTEEQKRRIEANRREALRRRREKQSQSQSQSASVSIPPFTQQP